jgi:hypothetical protein
VFRKHGLGSKRLFLFSRSRADAVVRRADSVKSPDLTAKPAKKPLPGTLPWLCVAVLRHSLVQSRHGALRRFFASNVVSGMTAALQAVSSPPEVFDRVEQNLGLLLA